MATTRVGTADDDDKVRTSLKLRRPVHAYMRERAFRSGISLQKLIEDLCEGAFREWSSMTPQQREEIDRG